MLVSSTSMNAAIATTTAISQGLNRGVQVTGAAAAVAGADPAGGGPGDEAPAVGVDAITGKPQMRTVIVRLIGCWWSAGGADYFTKTLGSTDIPSRKEWSEFSPGSSTIFTGTRCTTFT